MLNAGLVQVYVASAPDYYQNNWTALPFCFTSFAGYSYNYAAETEIGNLTCYFYLSKVTAHPPSITFFNMPTVAFKVMMISGTLVGEMTRIQHNMTAQRN